MSQDKPVSDKGTEAERERAKKFREQNGPWTELPKLGGESLWVDRFAAAFSAEEVSRATELHRKAIKLMIGARINRLWSLIPERDVDSWLKAAEEANDRNERPNFVQTFDPATANNPNCQICGAVMTRQIRKVFLSPEDTSTYFECLSCGATSKPTETAQPASPEVAEARIAKFEGNLIAGRFGCSLAVQEIATLTAERDAAIRQRAEALDYTMLGKNLKAAELRETALLETLGEISLCCEKGVGPETIKLMAQAAIQAAKVRR